jgi:hypothetical protein
VPSHISSGGHYVQRAYLNLGPKQQKEFSTLYKRSLKLDSVAPKTIAQALGKKAGAQRSEMNTVRKRLSALYRIASDKYYKRTMDEEAR